MFDFTKHITLSKDASHLYKKMRIVLYGVFAVITSLFVLLLLFPPQTLLFDFTNPNSLKNTLTTPVFDSGRFTFHGGIIGNHSQTKITLTLPKGTSLGNTPTIGLRHVYQAFATPLGDTVVTDDAIQESSPFISGDLLSSSQSIFVLDGTTLHAIDNEETFKSFGFSFDHVKKSDSEQRAVFTKDKLFTLKSPHPRGTVFYTTDTDRYYHKTPKGTLAEIKKPSNPPTVIPTEEESRDKSVTCALKKHLFFLQRYTCTVDLSDIADFTSNNYAFVLESEKNHIAQIRVHFTQSYDKKNLQQRMADIKKRIGQNYDGVTN